MAMANNRALLHALSLRSVRLRKVDMLLRLKA